MQERHYSSTALIWTNKKMEFGSQEDDISFDSFLLSYMGFIQGKLKEFISWSTEAVQMEISMD